MDPAVTVVASTAPPAWNEPRPSLFSVSPVAVTVNCSPLLLLKIRLSPVEAVLSEMPAAASWVFAATCVCRFANT